MRPFLSGKWEGNCEKCTGGARIGEQPCESSPERGSERCSPQKLFTDRQVGLVSPWEATPAPARSGLLLCLCTSSRAAGRKQEAKQESPGSVCSTVLAPVRISTCLRMESFMENTVTAAWILHIFLVSVAFLNPSKKPETSTLLLSET